MQPSDQRVLLPSALQFQGAPSLSVLQLVGAEHGYAISTGCTFLVAKYKHSHKVLFKIKICFLLPLLGL